MKKRYLYAITTVLIWSTMPTVVKTLLFDIPNLEVLSVSGVFAFLFLLIFNFCNGSIRQMKHYATKDYIVMSGLGFLGLFLYSALYYYGLAILTSQEACILNYLWPIMLVLFSCILLKERLTAMKIVAMGCSFLGIIILSTGSGAATSEDAAFGIISCILAAACYGLFSVLNKKADYNQNIAMMVMWLVVAVCALVFGLATEIWVPLNGMQLLGILWIGAITGGLAYLLWALALRESENTAAIANLAYLTPFLALIFSFLFLKEAIEVRAVLALIFIIGGILLQYFVDRKRAHSK